MLISCISGRLAYFYGNHFKCLFSDRKEIEISYFMPWMYSHLTFAPLKPFFMTCQRQQECRGFAGVQFSENVGILAL